MHIPAGSAKLVKKQVGEDWKGEGFVGAMPPEEQEAGWELVLPENDYNLMRKMKNYTKEKKRKFIDEKFQIDENEILDQY